MNYLLIPGIGHIPFNKLGLNCRWSLPSVRISDLELMTRISHQITTTLVRVRTTRRDSLKKTYTKQEENGS